MQGYIAALILYIIPVVLGIGCLVAFIVTMARPPHEFSPTARSLLVAFLFLYLGSTAVVVAWMFFLATWLYRKWLESFESGWVPEEQAGWWARYQRLERWIGAVEHAFITQIRMSVRRLRKLFVSARGRDDKQGL